jgi:hypothetical protein
MASLSKSLHQILVTPLGTAYFNQRTLEKLAKEDRERKRLEELYITLFSVKTVYSELSKKIASKIFEEVDIQTNSSTEMSPIVRLEMIINLYFPELKNIHSEFVNAKNIFGKEFGKVMIKSYKNELLENKKESFTNIYILLNIIDEKIEIIQAAITEIIKS